MDYTLYVQQQQAHRPAQTGMLCERTRPLDAHLTSCFADMQQKNTRNCTKLERIIIYSTVK